MGAFCESLRAAVKERLKTVFELFPKLKSLQSQTANSLSGGERRMVGIGRGLMAGAPIMLSMSHHWGSRQSSSTKFTQRSPGSKTEIFPFCSLRRTLSGRLRWRIICIS